MQKPMEGEHVTTLRTAGHAAECAGFDVDPETRVMVIVEGAQCGAPGASTDQPEAGFLEIANRTG